MVVCEVTRFIIISAIVSIGAPKKHDGILVRVPRQAHGKGNQQDQSSAETGFLGGGGVENSKYFQDIYVLRPDPMEIEFGHVFENPREWEQRYEKKDFNKNRHQGKDSYDFTNTLITQGSIKYQRKGVSVVKKKVDEFLSYQHLPEHDKYEFGHRRGNDHHVIERYEKAVPHEGQFKTKVRWADKKGGHGEHYWDYNHAGHGGEGNAQNNGDRNGGYSDPVPVYTPPHKGSKQHQKRQLEQEKKINPEDVDSSPQPLNHNQEREGTAFIDSFEKEIGGMESYDIQREAEKEKTNPVEKKSYDKASFDDSHLFFDLKTGKVVDELTGKKYILQPIN